ncbi:hypothetical protein F9U39_11400 [Pectobacterium versatile]|nr:hypothetical protein [Pectobacterium versatile]MBQ4790030.1 hypothetical protein [Pectobacterium versatile]MBQ4795438.1 hypothetical protein [Pectobacterium versatile]
MNKDTPSACLNSASRRKEVKRYDHSGYQSTFTISGLLLVMAATLTLLTSRKDIHPTH